MRGVHAQAEEPQLERQAPEILRIATTLAALAFAAQAACAPATIDADGPDFVESSEVVGKGRFQFEADVVAERDRRSPARITTLGTPTLLRFGVTDTVELRVETEGAQRVIDHNGTGTTAGGSGDTAFGVKWHTQDRDRATNNPAVSWILHFETPSGTGQFEGHGVTPSLRSVITWELPHDLALGFMPGIRYGSTPDGKRFASAIGGLVLNKQWTETLRTFVKIPRSRSRAPQMAASLCRGTPVRRTCFQRIGRSACARVWQRTKIHPATRCCLNWQGGFSRWLSLRRWP